MTNLISAKQINPSKIASKNILQILIITVYLICDFLELTQIAGNTYKSNHLFCFNQTKVVPSTPLYKNHITNEAPKIDKHSNNFNYEDNYKLSHTENPLIHKLY